MESKEITTITTSTLTPFTQRAPPPALIFSHKTPSLGSPQSACIDLSQVKTVLELDSWQWLRQHVCNIVLHGHLQQLNVSCSNDLPQLVVAHINVLCPCMMNWIFWKADCTLAVTVQPYRLLSNYELLNKTSKSNSLFCSLQCTNILRFSCG